MKLSQVRRETALGTAANQKGRVVINAPPFLLLVALFIFITLQNKDWGRIDCLFYVQA